MNEYILNYNKITDNDHRRKYGQFFTPETVANFMCRWVINDNVSELLDPAFGLGAFYKAVQVLQPKIKFYGTEIDNIILEYFHNNMGFIENLELIKGDYLTIWGKEYSAIICNPPYMRFQHFINRDQVYDAFERNLKVRLSGYTNLASAFLVKSLNELVPSGRLAYIMPLEFLNTGYGTVVKEQLLKNGRLKVLIRLEPEKDIFPDAITSIGIILACNDHINTPISLYSVTHLDELSNILHTKPIRLLHSTEIKTSDKWLKYFNNGKSSYSNPNLVKLNYYGNFVRGIATGANNYFCLSASEAENLGIPHSSFLRCISRSNQVKSIVFTEDMIDRLEQMNEHILLLNLNGNLTESETRYIKNGIKLGYDKRFLTKNRNPWYKLEKREPAPLLFGVFSRGKFKVIKNLSSAVNLTCYHCFYPNMFGHQFCDHLFLYLQTKAARHILGLSMRHYGDGLEKFEPNDLNQALVPSPTWFSKMSSESVNNAISYCRKYNTIPSELESLFEPILLDI